MVVSVLLRIWELRPKSHGRPVSARSSRHDRSDTLRFNGVETFGGKGEHIQPPIPSMEP